MKHYVSFTSVLIAVSQNQLTLEELQQPDALLCFGCAREHVLGNTIPMEVSWCFKNKHKTFNMNCDPNSLNSESLNFWNQFKNMVGKADKEGRVKYRIGNYPGYVEQCQKQSIPVWWTQWHAVPSEV